MGQVWQARDHGALARDVAIKLIKEEESDEHLQQQFRREAKIASELSHPRLMRVFDADWHAGQLFIVMELLQGHDLKAVMARNPRGLPVERALDLGIQLADGLSAVHSRSIVHRDLKPANLFVQPADQLKICDFGLARDNAAASQRGMLNSQLGTPLYAPPEWWTGKPAFVEPSADLYTAGGILYEMLTGRAPFGDSPSIAALMLRHIGERPVPPRDRNQAVPQALSDLILTLLDKDPSSRASASTLHASLLRLSRSPARAGTRTGAGNARPAAPQPAAPRAAAPGPPAARVTAENGEVFAYSRPLDGYDPAQPVGQPQFSPDSRYLAASVPGGALIWEAASGSLAGPRAVAADEGRPRLEFAADGVTLLMVSGRRVLFWDVSTGRPAAQRPVTAEADPVVSPGGRFLAVATGKSVLLRDLADRARVYGRRGYPDYSGYADYSAGQSGSSGELSARGKNVFSNVAFSSDARLIAATSDRRKLHIWETGSRRPVRDPIPIPFPGAVCFSPDNRLVSVATSGSVELWDITERKPQCRAVSLSGGSNVNPRTLAFTPDSRVLAIQTGHNANFYTTDFWDIGSGASLGSIKSWEAGGAPKFTSDGRRAVTITDGGGTMHILDRRTLKPAGKGFTHADSASAVIETAISPDSRFVASIGYRGLIPRLPGPKSHWSIRLWRFAN